MDKWSTSRRSCGCLGHLCSIYLQPTYSGEVNKIGKKFWNMRVGKVIFTWVPFYWLAVFQKREHYFMNFKTFYLVLKKHV